MYSAWLCDLFLIRSAGITSLGGSICSTSAPKQHFGRIARCYCEHKTLYFKAKPFAPSFRNNKKGCLLDRLFQHRKSISKVSKILVLSWYNSLSSRIRYKDRFSNIYECPYILVLLTHVPVYVVRRFGNSMTQH